MGRIIGQRRSSRRTCRRLSTISPCGRSLRRSNLSLLASSLFAAPRPMLAVRRPTKRDLPGNSNLSRTAKRERHRIGTFKLKAKASFWTLPITGTSVGFRGRDKTQQTRSLRESSWHRLRPKSGTPISPFAPICTRKQTHTTFSPFAYCRHADGSCPPRSSIASLPAPFLKWEG